ncbi:MAG: hypothetical protein ABW223_07615 [Rariglobus sp.]
MLSLIKKTALLVAFSAFCLCAQAAHFDLGRTGDLYIDAPASWKVKSRLIEGVGYEFTFTPANGTNAKALITLVTQAAAKPVDPKKIDADFIQTCRPFVAASVEKKADLRRYQLKQGYGVYAIFTDAALVEQPAKPNDYKVMAPGLIQLTDSIQALATLFADDANGPEMAAMRAFVESLRITPAITSS